MPACNTFFQLVSSAAGTLRGLDIDFVADYLNAERVADGCAPGSDLIAFGQSFADLAAVAAHFGFCIYYAVVVFLIFFLNNSNKKQKAQKHR